MPVNRNLNLKLNGNPFLFFLFFLLFQEQNNGTCLFICNGMCLSESTCANLMSCSEKTSTCGELCCLFRDFDFSPTERMKIVKLFLDIFI